MKINRYRYYNVRNKCIIFECDAPNILVADGKLLAAHGIIAEKAKYIACEISLMEKMSWLEAKWPRIWRLVNTIKESLLIARKRLASRSAASGENG